MTQIVTRLPDDLAAQVDELVRSGAVGSRSEAVREGLLLLVDRFHRARTAQAIIDGYRRFPQTDSDVGWSDHATRQMIAEEPW